MQEIDREDVRRLVSEGAQLVEVLPAKEYEEDHLPGAVSLPLRQLEAEARTLLDRNRPVVVYCWGPGCNGGAKAALELASLGVPVKEMLGGFEYWAREGYPVEGAAGPIHRAIDPLTAPVEHAVSCDC